MAKRKESTIAALMEDKPKRGRPRRSVSRQNVYVALSLGQKRQIHTMSSGLPEGLSRADIPDMAVGLLATRMEVLRQAVADRDREIPEGVTDMDSLYLLWDLPLPAGNGQAKWTSIRLSPQKAIDLGRVQGVLNAMFGVNRSQVFSLSLTLLEQFLDEELEGKPYQSLEDVDRWIDRIYL